MAPSDDIQVGDSVNVPGGMHGTIRFLGTVVGKQGRFAGVELAPEHAGKGKNSGDVDGRGGDESSSTYFLYWPKCLLQVPHYIMYLSLKRKGEGEIVNNTTAYR